jgi:tetratricopeptide (TPR) repeat protein
MTYSKHFTNRRTAGPIKVIMISMICIAVVAHAAVNILHTDAADAFKAGDYERAATEFAQLVSENPDDVTLLRYLGITLRKLEHYNDALITLEKALNLDPASVAVNYHIAITLYKAGAFQNALEFFSVVTALDADSKYARLAGEYMATISDQLARAQSPTAPKRFSFYGQVAGQYDSNLLATPDDLAILVGDSSATRISGYLSGQYNYINKNNWLGTLDLSAYTAAYTDDEFSDSDIGQFNPGFSIQKTTMLGRFPAVHSARYDYLNVEIDGNNYSESNVGTLMSRLTFTPNTGTRFSYAYTRDKFDFKGFDSEFSSRDADNHAINALNTWYLNKRMIELDLGLGYIRNNADGLNFNYDAWKVAAAARFALPKEWWLDLGATWSRDNYPDFAGPVKRETDVADVTLAVRRWFWNKILLQADVSYHEEDSSYDSLNYDRYNIALKASYAY